MDHEKKMVSVEVIGHYTPLLGKNLLEIDFDSLPGDYPMYSLDFSFEFILSF
jgi:hypothetical protein